jgi:hypothetical protein
VENPLQKHLFQKQMKARSTTKPEQSRHQASNDRGGPGHAQQATAVADSRPEMAQQQGLLRLMAGSQVLQKKLAIGAADDPLEREADRVADQVMAAPAPSAVSGGSVRIQRFPGIAGGRMHGAPASVDRALARSGSPLEPALRKDMEQRFGHDFSRVRVHLDAQAHQSAWDVNAHAYTVGNDIVFGEGRYLPATHEGRRLLAHELTHVLQQGQGGLLGNGMSVQGDAFERQANAVSEEVIGGRSVRPMFHNLRPSAVAAQPPSTVMRQTETRPNPAEYEFVPITKGGTWDAKLILGRISQREYTETRIPKSQPLEGGESDDYRCGPNAVLASAIAAGPKVVEQLCINLYKRIVEWRERAKKDDEVFREKQRAARRAGKNPEAIQKTMPFADVCERAARTVFNIHWNLNTGILHGSHEGGGCTLTFADLDRLSGYLYVFTFDTNVEWRLDAETARKVPTLDGLQPEVRSRLEPLFQKAKNAHDEKRKLNPSLPELTWNDFRRQLAYRAKFRTEAEISDAAALAGYEANKAMIRTQEITEKLWLNWHLDRLKPGESLIGMWGPHTYTFFCGQDKKIYLYDAWRAAEDEEALVLTFDAANSVHEQGTPAYEMRIQKGLTGEDKPIKLLLGAAHFTARIQ